ncbi:MAG TPA: hypothetical protein VFW25_14265 [Silvibacterium sp.]|nr:hypothetical protein [Silvibacterium sp.]
MSPRIQLALSISAIIYGFTLIAALIYGGSIASHPIETFLGMLLLTGGMLFLWKKWAPRAEETKPEIPNRAAVRATILGPAASLVPAPPPAATATAAPPAPTAALGSLAGPATLELGTDAPTVEQEISDEEFLAQFLKK